MKINRSATNRNDEEVLAKILDDFPLERWRGVFARHFIKDPPARAILNGR